MQHRISVKLDKSLLDSFTNHSNSAGVSKSKLIKQWILDFPNANFINTKVNALKFTSYTIRVDDPTFKNLNTIAGKYNLSLSGAIRFIIRFNLENYKSKNNYLFRKQVDMNDKIFDFWKTGQYSNALEMVSGNIENLTPKDLLNIIRAAIDMGKIKYAFELIEYMYKLVKKNKNPDTTNYIFQYTKLVEAEACIASKKFIRAKQILDELKLHEPNFQTRGIKGFYYCLKGELTHYRERPIKAIGYFEKALDSLDQYHYSLYMSRIYLRIGRSWKYYKNFQIAKRYYKKVLDLNKFQKNAFLYGNYHSEMASLEIIQGNATKAMEHVVKSEHYYKKTGSMIGNYQSELSKGIILLNIDEIDNAYNSFSKCVDIQSNYKENTEVSFSKLIKNVIEAKDNFQRANDLIKMNVAKISDDYLPSMVNYLKSTPKYLYSPDKDERDEGLVELRRLLETTKDKVVQRAALSTIENKQLKIIF